MFVTWRLHGSLPAHRNFPEMPNSGRALLALDQLLDRGSTGPLHLARPQIASMVVEAIRFREGTLAHYRLHSWVVMANHVHLLITPLVEVSQIMQSLKRFTTRAANRLLCSTGQAFWQEESFDWLVRGEVEFARITRYIEVNPGESGWLKRQRI
jgi:REP element-mobilizing transposase RayT